jgi:LL-diaminopimelate aminotransferase
MRFSLFAKNSPSYFFANYLKKVRQYEKEKGIKVTDLTVGSPSYPPSKKYLKKLQELIFEEKNYLYPGYGGDKDLKKALSSWYQKRFNVFLDEDCFLPVLGGKDAISHLPPLVLDKDDKILVPNPGYPGFFGTVSFFYGKVVFYPLFEKDNFLIDFLYLEKLIDKKTKAIFVNYPSNPTGALANKSFLKKLVDFCLKKDLFLFYDNAYSEIYFDSQKKPPSIFEIKNAKKIALEIGSFSKTFSFAGLRLGWLAAEKEVIDKFLKIKSQFDSGVPLLFQKLASYALDNFDEEWYQKMINFYQSQRDYLFSFFKKIGLEVKLPLAGLYLWIKVSKDFCDGFALSQYLLEKYQIAVTPGEAFGSYGKKYIRVSFSGKIEKKL